MAVYDVRGIRQTASLKGVLLKGVEGILPSIFQTANRVIDAKKARGQDARVTTTV